MKADIIESVPDYIEDFIFEPRVEGECTDDDWDVEDEELKARIECNINYYGERKAEIREYEGGIECEGYRCYVNRTELVIILYASREWIVYRYHNEDVPGVPFYCKRINGEARSIREAIKAIEQWRRTKKKEFEALRNSVWNRRGTRRNNARR